MEGEPTIQVKNLSFEYSTPGYSSTTALTNITFSLPQGSRCLLIGANGAGKSTLLRIIAGKHLIPDDQVIVLGKPSFYQTLGLSGITFLGQNWTKTVAFAGTQVPYQADIPVRDMLKPLQEEFSDRRNELYQVLDINPEWRMHQVSDGQRRRVQIMLGLLRPFKILLLDEITVDLDVLARKNFLLFLEKECSANNATIVYATHIFDGLDSFPTHLVLMDEGMLIKVEHYEQVKTRESFKGLYNYVVDFLTERQVQSAGKKRTRQREDKGLEGFKEDKPFGERVNSGYTPGRMLSYFSK